MRVSPWIALVYLVYTVQGIKRLRNSHGYFKSPNFPEPYRNGVTKKWIIQVRKGYRIKFKFTAFDLEDSYDERPCVYDYLLITEGGEELKRFCGNPSLHNYPSTPRINRWYYSQNNSITVRFVTDYSNGDIEPIGFYAHYVEIDIDECAILDYKQQTLLRDWDELITCNHFCINVLGSYYCECRVGFELAPNNHTCVATFCENQHLTDDEGEITSPDYPLPYGKLSNCQWDINVRKGLSINVKFTEPFDIEEHPDAGCSYDTLNIQYEDNSTTYCNAERPPFNRTLHLNTRNVTVRFQSDLSVEGTGFQLYYNTTKIRCEKPLRAPINGTITSTNNKSYYEFEDVVTFACDLGFDMQGHQHTVCNDEGEWAHDEPTCQIISCGSPDNLIAVNYSHIVDFAGKEFTYLEKVTVRCNQWYKQTAGYATWKCEHTKKWIPYGDSTGGREIPVCRPKCGKRLVLEDLISTHISSGKAVVKPGGWPWMAFVDLGGGRDGKRYCGGTLVDEMTVLTAAHCIFDIDMQDNVTVWLGLLNRSSEETESYVQSFNITADRRYVHPNYGGPKDNFNNDVAVLELDRPANLSFYIRPICLPYGNSEALLRQYRDHRSDKAMALGWGVTENGSLSNTLRKVRLNIVSNDECQHNYKTALRDSVNITDTMICAGYLSSSLKSDTCKADSGGPLMTQVGKRKQAVWYLSGITSFGDEKEMTDGNSRCGRGRTFGVYTNVGKVMNFTDFYVVK